MLHLTAWDPTFFFFFLSLLFSSNFVLSTPHSYDLFSPKHYNDGLSRLPQIHHCRFVPQCLCTYGSLCVDCPSPPLPLWLSFYSFQERQLIANFSRLTQGRAGPTPSPSNTEHNPHYGKPVYLVSPPFLLPILNSRRGRMRQFLSNTAPAVRRCARGVRSGRMSERLNEGRDRIPPRVLDWP